AHIEEHEKRRQVRMLRNLSVDEQHCCFYRTITKAFVNERPEHAKFEPLIGMALVVEHTDILEAGSIVPRQLFYMSYSGSSENADRRCRDDHFNVNRSASARSYADHTRSDNAAAPDGH